MGRLQCCEKKNVLLLKDKSFDLYLEWIDGPLDSCISNVDRRRIYKILYN